MQRPAVTIERPDQLKALGHPLRLRVLELLSDAKPLTNHELAGALDLDPGHLHFHVRMLLRAGLIEFAEGGQGREKPYRAVAQSLHLSPELRATGLVGNAQAAMIETVSRGWVAFVAQGRFRSVKATAHISPERLQQLLRDFFERVREAEEATLAATGAADAELLVSVFYHPPPQGSAAEHGLSADTATSVGSELAVPPPAPASPGSVAVGSE